MYRAAQAKRTRGRRRSPAGGSVPRLRGLMLASVGRSGAPGLGLAWDLAQERAHGMGDLRGRSERRFGAGKGLLDGEGGSAATKLTEAQCTGT